MSLFEQTISFFYVLICYSLLFSTEIILKQLIPSGSANIKHLKTGPSGIKKVAVSRGHTVILPDSKIEKTRKKTICLRPLHILAANNNNKVLSI